MVGVVSNPATNILDATVSATTPATGCVGAVLAPGATANCTYTDSVAGNPGDVTVASLSADATFLGGQVSAVTSNDVTFTIAALAPSAPLGVVATPSNGQVALDWDDVASADEYHVYRSETAGVLGAEVTTSVLTVSDFVDSGLTNGVTYYYVVTGENSVGEGAGSGEIPAVPTPVIERINAGGGVVASGDVYQDWEADTTGGNHPTLSNAGSNNSSNATVPTLDASVPASVPAGVFAVERYSTSATPSMGYSVPVTPGSDVEVRLFIAEAFSGAQPPGTRIYDVLIEGDVVLDDLEPNVAYGFQVGHMESFLVTDDGDGVIDISWAKLTAQHPNISAIEVLAV